MNQSSERLSTADFVSAGEDNENQRGARREVEAPGPLLSSEVVQDLRGRWADVQAGFVDDPQAAVRRSDELVAAAIKRLAESFAEQRDGLERQWRGGGNVSTEDLRQALRKYRAFFERLLAIPAPMTKT